jgi:hypothetical protein
MEIGLRLRSGGLRHPARHGAGKCDGCRRSFNDVLLAPVLQDAVWCRLAGEKEVLCADCCFQRASERDIDLTRASLRLCALNLAGWPWSYFNLFTDAKKQSSDRRAHIYETYLNRCEVEDPVDVEIVHVNSDIRCAAHD